MKTVIKRYPPEKGVLTQLYAATSSEVTKADSGAYFAPWARKATVERKEAADPELGKKLWDWCDDQMRKAGLNETLANDKTSA